LSFVAQPIEGLNVSDFGWGGANAQTITLSFWVKSSVTGSFPLVLVNSGTSRAYGATYTISAANTWEQKTVVVPGDTSGTWLTTNGVGIQVNWGLGGAGASRTVTTGWQTPSSPGSSVGVIAGTVNLVATTGATWQVTGVQLEAGSVATPFERRDYGRELMLCQRYYWQQARGNNLMISLGTLYDASNLNGYVQFPVSMRTTPSIVQTTGTNYYIFERAAATDFFDAFGLLTRGSTACAQLFIGSGISGASGGQSGIIFTNNASAAIGYNAEL
jgi:hypothetical protein